MAILHKNITSSLDIHNPKWHPDANNGDYAWKNEKGELESIDELLLPAAINFVDGSVAPPTSNANDIYILSSGASVNAGWGSVALQDWCKYDGSLWYAITPQKSSLCYDKTADSLMSFNGSAWAAIGGGGGGDSIYTVSGTVPTSITATITDTLTFAGGKIALSSINDGILLNRVTNAQMAGITGMVEDEIVFNTEVDNLYRYDGSNWVALTTGTGILAVNDTNGSPTFYASYNAAITAASAGDTITQFGNITDSGNNTVLINKAININLNGYTYHNSSTGTSDAISVTITGVQVKIVNGNIKRSGGVYSSFANRGVIVAPNTNTDLSGTTISNENGMVLGGTGANIKVFNGIFVGTGTATFSVNSDANFIGSIFETTGINKFTGILYNVKASSTTTNKIEGANSEARFCEFRVTSASGESGLLINLGKAFYCECFTAATGSGFGALAIGGADAEAHYCFGSAPSTFGIFIGTNNPKGIYNCTGISGNNYGGKITDIDEIISCTFISETGGGAVISNAADAVFQNCNFIAQNTSSYTRAFYDSGTSGTIRVYSCYVQSDATGGGTESMLFTSGRTVYLADNRIKGGSGITNPNGNSQTTTPDSVGNIILD